jgi:hypothetical protein
MDKKIFVVGVALIALVVLTSLLIGPKNTVNKSTVNEPESYISCGCGCCGTETENAQTQCLYKSKGEAIQSKIDQDNALTPEYCANVGCSMPTKYVYCD